MNETASNWEPSPELHPSADVEATAPEFGLVDIVEAFTAMRHEWRGQTKESRAVKEAIEQAATVVQGLEGKVLARLVDRDTDDARALAESVAEIDHQLTRSIETLARTNAARDGRRAEVAHAVQRYFDGLSPWKKWGARPLFAFTLDMLRAAEEPPENPLAEGLELMLGRLRRTMREHDIERVDTLGQEFDANRMNAVGTVPSADVPSGRVAEQITPCYLRLGQVLRFADVRVSTGAATNSQTLHD